MTRAVIRLLVVTALLVISGCSPAKPPASAPSTSAAVLYGQVLPRDLCNAFDFNPIIASLDLGAKWGNTIYDAGGTQNRWYACHAKSMLREGPDKYLYGSVSIRISFFETVEKATKEYDDELTDLKQPADLALESVDRSVRDTRPIASVVIVQDRNLVIFLGAGGEQGRPLADAVGIRIEELTREVLAFVRRSATS